MAWTERYVRSDAAGGGDGTTDTNSGGSGAWTLAEGITNEAAGQRINVRAGTYANTTTSRTFAAAGTTTAPIWWRGFNATAGDLDNDFTTAKPAITFTTGRFIVTGSYHLFSNLSISGAQTASVGQVRLATGTNMYFDRCRIEDTAANANASAVSCSVNRTVFTRCYLKCTSSAPIVIYDTASQRVFQAFNVFEGGSNGVTLTSTIVLVSLMDAFRSVGGDAVRSTAASEFYLLLPTISSPGSDGVEMATTIPTFGAVVGSVIGNTAGYAINNSTGANTANIIRIFNDYFTSSLGNENGFGDFPALSGQTESSSPWTSSTDLSLVAGAVARQKLPGLFEGESFTGYHDLGAVGAVAAAAGGGVTAPTNVFGAEGVWVG